MFLALSRNVYFMQLFWIIEQKGYLFQEKTAASGLNVFSLFSFEINDSWTQIRDAVDAEGYKKYYFGYGQNGALTSMDEGDVTADLIKTATFNKVLTENEQKQTLIVKAYAAQTDGFEAGTDPSDILDAIQLLEGEY